MQKRPSSVATDQEISDIQNDPVLQKLFEDAIEVLRLAGADKAEYGTRLEEKHQESQVQHRASREKKKQPQRNNEKQAKRLSVITKSKRKKLERIKATVTVFRKPKQDEIPSEEEQQSSVKKMLCYVDQMPSQETFQPPPLPFVSLSRDENDETDHSTEEMPADTSRSIQDYTYLSSYKDVALWKMLVTSPTNLNVFVGGLSRDVTSEILHAAFEAFILKEEDKARLKAHVVMDVTRQQSKGYGFVTFPCRRSAELALICMQDFEIHGRAMQLGWGQENREEKMSNAEDFRVTIADQEQHSEKVPGKCKGNVVSDTVYSDRVEFSSKQSLKRCFSRWDQETPKKYQRMEESAKLDRSQEDIPESNEEGLMWDVCQPILPHNEQLDNSTAGNEIVSCKSGQSPRRGVLWLTHEQKVELLKTVCSNLRASEVRGHVGVFGVHYEADNSRLYVVCAKHVTESQLLHEFSVFGTAQVKLNTDANGFSKGCAFVQYTSSNCAEKAIKQLHGKVVGGLPMKVMVAEPKVCKVSRTRKNTAKL